MNRMSLIPNPMYLIYLHRISQWPNSLPILLDIPFALNINIYYPQNN